jgi:putative phosphotransacetylase
MTELDHINMTTQNIAPSREHVERLVRESIYSQFGRPAPVDGPSSLVVNSSARHMHISQENLEVLFGPGAELEVHKWLYQEGQFAAKQTVTLVGPRKRIIPNLRILGPCRDITQIELAYTDSIQLGIDIPVKMSGDIEGTPGGYVMGPAGMLEMKNGIIRAARHVHMHPRDAEFYGVKHKDMMKLKVTSPANTIVFEDMLARVDESFKLEVHIDTDEANACGLHAATKVELIK